MMLLKQRPSQRLKGFSLTELMIVVAIMGVLLSISVPSFRNYQLQAYQSEAKTELSALYTAEASFKLDWGTYYGNFVVIGYQPKGELAYVTGFHEGCTTGCWGECDDGVTTGSCTSDGSGIMRITNAKTIQAPDMMGSSSTCKPLGVYYGFDIGANANFVNVVNTGDYPNDNDKNGGCKGDADGDGDPDVLGCSYIGHNFGADALKNGNNDFNKKTCATVADFLAGSVGKLKKNDVWSIDQAKNLVHIKNGLQ